MGAADTRRVTRSAVWPWMRELRHLTEAEKARAEEYRDAGVAYDGIKGCYIVAYELVPFIVEPGEDWT